MITYFHSKHAQQVFIVIMIIKEVGTDWMLNSIDDEMNTIPESRDIVKKHIFKIKYLDLLDKRERVNVILFMVVIIIHHGEFIRQVTMRNLFFLQRMRLIITYDEIFCLFFR